MVDWPGHFAIEHSFDTQLADRIDCVYFDTLEV